jgi:hypothetical protein
MTVTCGKYYFVCSRHFLRTLTGRYVVSSLLSFVRTLYDDLVHFCVTLCIRGMPIQLPPCFALIQAKTGSPRFYSVPIVHN